MSSAAGRTALPRLRLLMGAAVVLWVNYYISRDVFHLIHNSRTNSMHGFWMAMARLAGSQWFHAGWWPYCDAGAPFEFIYAPLTPALMALWSCAGAISVSQAFFCVSALYYVLGPLTLYAFAAWLTNSALVSTSVALCYTLLSPASLLIPDSNFNFREIFTDRRAYLMGVWDDTPHMAALVILPLLWIFLCRAVLHKRWRDIVLTILLMSLEAAATAFGPVLVVLSVLCALFALSRGNWIRGLTLASAMGIAAYGIASPFLPPSLIESIRRNASEHGQNGWDASAFTALSLVVLAWVLIWQKLPLWTGDWRTHFVVLFALLTASIPALWQYFGRTFVPQPSRYRSEMDLAWSLLLVFGARALWKRLPRPVAVACALVLLSLAAEQIVHHRRNAKDIFAPVDIAGTLDFQTAQFIDANLPSGGRVFLPGSMAQWFNFFSRREQFSGSSFSTAYNPVHQAAFNFINAGEGAKAILWLKAFGVQAIAVPGKDSPETWHPISPANKFDGLLEPVWKKRDTTLYRVPVRSLSLAHIIDKDAVVKQVPRRGSDTAELSRYVAALENAALPTSTWRWKGYNQAEASAVVAAGQVFALQVSFHPGWHARVNGRPVPLQHDGLGLMWLQPPGAGRAKVELRYDGGREQAVCRGVSLLICSLLAGYSAYRLIRRRKSALRQN